VVSCDPEDDVSSCDDVIGDAGCWQDLPRAWHPVRFGHGINQGGLRLHVESTGLRRKHKPSPSNA